MQTFQEYVSMMENSLNDHDLQKLQQFLWFVAEVKGHKYDTNPECAEAERILEELRGGASLTPDNVNTFASLLAGLEKSVGASSVNINPIIQATRHILGLPEWQQNTPDQLKSGYEARQKAVETEKQRRKDMRAAQVAGDWDAYAKLSKQAPTYNL